MTLVPASSSQTAAEQLAAAVSVTVAAAGGEVGFYGGTPQARPQVPASPTAQDVVDALVTLGLVTQAA